MDLPGLPQLDRCLVMGVLNVTPDSFSDGGAWLDPERAVAAGRAMSRDGADLVDVGGESTRPGAERVPVAEERRRVLPVVAGLVEAGVAVSVDTSRAEVARAALAAGARLVNDVTGGVGDPELPGVVAAAGVPYVVMHSRGPSRDMADRAVYTDVVGEVCAELADRIEALAAAGVDRGAIVVDPGLGFAKTAEHNWALLAELDALAVLGRPVLLGASRKAFLGALLGGAGVPRAPAGRDAASVAAAAIAAYAGVWGVRVHDVAATADAVRVSAEIRRRRQEVAW